MRIEAAMRCRPWTGWQAVLLAAFCGALLVLALPPFSLPVFLPVAFGVLFLLVVKCTVSRAALLGWAFGVSHFALSLSWIGESFQIDAERFGHLAFPAIAALAAGLAFFPAFAAATFAAMRTRGLSGALIFASAWAASEWLRGTVLTGFPWNLVAYTWADFDIPRQTAARTGSYGLGLLTVLAATLPAAAIMSGRRERVGALVLGTALCSIVWISGTLRLRDTTPDTTTKVRIVQPNVPQREKWNEGLRARNVQRLLDLSTLPGSFDLLLWPETAYPGYIEEEPWFLGQIANLLPPGAVLLTGAVTQKSDPTGLILRNAILAIDTSGRVFARYAKHNLVPFGEYVPFRGVLPLERFTEGAGDFTPGPGPATLPLPDLPPVGPAICYEAIFPGYVVDPVDRPNWIFNATNDGWFGQSIGPRQHLAAARMRAVEEGLPMVRAANTGVSAVIDANGRITKHIPLGEEGILDAYLPASRPATIFGRHKQMALLSLLMASLFSAGLIHNSRKVMT